MPDTPAPDPEHGSLDQAVVTTETGGTIKTWNAVAESTYGWTAEEAIGRSIYDLLIPHSRRAEALNIMAGVGAGRVWAGQFVLRHRDGFPLSVSMTSSPVYGVGRRVAGIVSVSGPLGDGDGARHARTARILVAEDDPRSRELMVEILRDAGYEVVEVSDGALALGALRDWRQAFDMVVLDMQMPGVDGMVVASEIRRDRRLRDLPVLAVTALTQPGDAVRVLEAGCDAYLAKPVSVSEVRKMVAEMLADSHGPHWAMSSVVWGSEGVRVDGVVEREFTIQGERDVIHGVLWAPEQIPAGSPLVLIGHGGGGHKRAPSVVPTAQGFVREHGIPAVIIDAPGHGDRGGAQGRSPEYYALWSDAKRMTDHGIADWKRVLTAFLDTGMFDPARVGWSGMSMGSLIGVPYVAAETRLKAAALGLCGFTGVTPNQGGGGAVLEAAAPNITIPLIFMLQWDDERFDRPGSIAMFGAFGATDKRLVWHVGAHAEMPEEGRRHARAFLAERLKG